MSALELTFSLNITNNLTRQLETLVKSTQSFSPAVDAEGVFIYKYIKEINV